MLFKLSFASLANLLSGHCHVLIIILRSQIIHGAEAALVHQIYLDFSAPPGRYVPLGDVPSYSALGASLVSAMVRLPLCANL